MSLSHPVALFPALFFTVALLVTTAYFLLGGLPLLVLQHDTPTDARFVRGFFNVYYRAALVTSAGAAPSDASGACTRPPSCSTSCNSWSWSGAS